MVGRVERESPSLWTSTVPSITTRRATRRRPGSSSSRSGWSPATADSRSPTRSMRRSRWWALSSSTASETSPLATAAASVGPNQADGPGISRSSPAVAAGAVLWVPNQSDMTRPSKPHSPRRMVPMESSRLLAAVDAVDLVVGRHDGPHAGFFDGGLEGGQVDLAQRAVVHFSADGHALMFLVVAGEVLDATGHAVLLDAAHIGHGQARREQRVLGERLEGPAGQGRPGDADGRPQEDAHALGYGFGGEDGAEFADQRGVPGRPDRHAAGQGQRATPDQAVAAHSRGPVGDLERRDAQSLDGRQVPQAHPRGERRLLLNGHGTHQGARCRCPPLVMGFLHTDHQVSTNGRRLAVPPGPPASVGGADRRAWTTRALVSAGSMTSSISKCAATLMALPCS